jgi:hypothetical protein
MLHFVNALHGYFIDQVNAIVYAKFQVYGRSGRSAYCGF